MLHPHINFYPRPPRGGRHSYKDSSIHTYLFLSTPSARRATKYNAKCTQINLFLSTPSARRATIGSCSLCSTLPNFYPRPPRGGRPILRCTLGRLHQISIHALREEGDEKPHHESKKEIYFYPRPPRGGRPSGCEEGRHEPDFYPRPPRGGRQKQ